MGADMQELELSDKAVTQIAYYVKYILREKLWNNEDDWLEYELDDDVIDINIWRDDNYYLNVTVYATMSTPNGLATDTDVWYELPLELLADKPIR